jgi:hypothetical protein
MIFTSKCRALTKEQAAAITAFFNILSFKLTSSKTEPLRPVCISQITGHMTLTSEIRHLGLSIGKIKNCVKISTEIECIFLAYSTCLVKILAGINIYNLGWYYKQVSMVSQNKQDNCCYFLFIFFLDNYMMFYPRGKLHLYQKDSYRDRPLTRDIPPGSPFYHSLPSAHTFTSVIGSPNVQDYFRFNTPTKFFFLNNLRQCFPVEPNICHFHDIFYHVYLYLQILCWQAHCSHINSALGLIHYMEIPTIMWVYSGAKSTT